MTRRLRNMWPQLREFLHEIEIVATLETRKAAMLPSVDHALDMEAQSSPVRAIISPFKSRCIVSSAPWYFFLTKCSEKLKPLWFARHLHLSKHQLMCSCQVHVKKRQLPSSCTLHPRKHQGFICCQKMMRCQPSMDPGSGVRIVS